MRTKEKQVYGLNKFCYPYARQQFSNLKLTIFNILFQIEVAIYVDESCLY